MSAEPKFIVGPYVVERLLNSYVVLDARGNDERRSAAFYFHDEAGRERARRDAIRTAEDLRNTSILSRTNQGANQ